jgi:hypothetical protein
MHSLAPLCQEPALLFAAREQGTLRADQGLLVRGWARGSWISGAPMLATSSGARAKNGEGDSRGLQPRAQSWAHR